MVGAVERNRVADVVVAKEVVALRRGAAGRVPELREASMDFHRRAALPPLIPRRRRRTRCERAGGNRGRCQGLRLRPNKFPSRALSAASVAAFAFRFARSILSTKRRPFSTFFFVFVFFFGGGGGAPSAAVGAGVGGPGAAAVESGGRAPGGPRVESRFFFFFFFCFFFFFFATASFPGGGPGGLCASVFDHDVPLFNEFRRGSKSNC